MTTPIEQQTASSNTRESLSELASAAIGPRPGTAIVHNCENYTPARLGRKLGVHPSAPIRWCKKGRLLRDGTRRFLNGFRSPGGWIIPASAVDEFFAVLTLDARVSRDREPFKRGEHDLAEAALISAGF